MIRTTIGSEQLKELVTPKCVRSNNSIGKSWAQRCKKEKKFYVDKLSFWVRHGKLPGYVWLEVTIFPLFDNGVLIGRKELPKWEKPLKVLYTDDPPCIHSSCSNYKNCQFEIKSEVVSNYGP